ncbi:hypothetical protein I1E95_07080 [Synechococcus sp. CBW1107]|uniref:hypothetical protein n=1 Tax=Synechococcus sp. CBW1107 TaxID=2789857 RepID=UPI0018CEFC7C|nr:hypothetical protein [Synechococcus sp. CBW1107]QPN57815.1 hypothetical protein I1E95_07080 [Synechococcus sp. CBW1107]
MDSGVSFVTSTGSSPTERNLALFDWLESWFRSPGFHGCLFLKASSKYPPIRAISSALSAHA